jgi:hypothetical protein
LNGQQIPADRLTAVQRNASRGKDFTRSIPKPIVIVTSVNGHHVRALVDTSSLADFMSTTLADQLKVEKVQLEKPLPVQLAIQGSRTKANWGAFVDFAYQKIKSKRYFDVINLDGYDLILGTPFLW